MAAGAVSPHARIRPRRSRAPALRGSPRGPHVSVQYPPLSLVHTHMPDNTGWLYTLSDGCSPGRGVTLHPRAVLPPRRFGIHAVPPKAAIHWRQ